MVTDYLKHKGAAFPSEIAEDLGLSIMDVMTALESLQKEKKVEEVR